MKKLRLKSDFTPSKDQDNAINSLVNGINKGYRYQVLEGVTGSGKTFTMANVIARLQMPTLIMSHNKSLCNQLFSEFQGFFPHNFVEYFVSHFDYYQPEAYIPRRDLFVEKDSSINEDLSRLRLSASTSLLAYDDVVVIASVSANYGLGNPAEYLKMVFKIEVGDKIVQKNFLRRLVDIGYVRNDNFLELGEFRVLGDIIDIFPAYLEDRILRVEFFSDEIESLTFVHRVDFSPLNSLDSYALYAANPFIVSESRLKEALKNIKLELKDRLKFYDKEGRMLEFDRLKSRVEYDLEMIKENGICKGIENYARHLTGRKAGETPYSLLDYFENKQKPYLVIVDESHVSLPQFRGMFAGDRSRKEVLVDYGFRLPSALDNRPLNFDEFINKAPFFIFVSATPSELEINMSRQVVRQLIRPTGLLDPIIEIRSSDTQVQDLKNELTKIIERNERALVASLTKKMAEELSKYLIEHNIKARYMHSDIDANERNHIIRMLRMGEFDVLVGVNLLREGLDLPEVSLVAILDADKEGFLRSTTSLIQTMGRAARNINGKVILYANKTTKSMEEAINTSRLRRKTQEEYNKQHNISPRSTTRKIEEELTILKQDTPNLDKIPSAEKDKIIKELTKKMLEASKSLEFETAAALRDKIARLRKKK